MPAPVLAPDVEAFIENWTPTKAVPNTPRGREVVLPAVKKVVRAAAPRTPSTARRMSQYVGPMLTWADEEIKSVDAGVLNPRNNDAFIAAVQSDPEQGRLPAWIHEARSVLDRVGRAVNPSAAWSDKRLRVPNAGFSLPYDGHEEHLILRACHLPGARNPIARLWVPAAAMGAGMSGLEALIAETSDVTCLEGGRLAIQVRGRKPRLVPVREGWTDTVSEAIRLVNARGGSSQRFFPSDNRAVLGYHARSLPCGLEGGFEYRRARATWLAAHVRADTSLHALQMLAGSLSADVLRHLFAVLDLHLTPMEAVREGLRA